MSQIIHSVAEWQLLRKQSLFADKTIGFVPTMGNLHAGHESLLAKSVADNELTILSVFVNPTQFDNPNDLSSYPHTLNEDVRIAKTIGTNFIVIPKYDDIYPDNYRYRVNELSFSQQLCGAHRPGHFEGVLTIVLKLLNLIKPTHVYFGEKDFQQLQLIKDLVTAFFLDVQVIACPTIRDVNGLALSSRNSRLSPDEYQLALKFPALLKSNLSCEEINQELAANGFKVDYIEEHHGRRFGAVKTGEVRLIDNILFTNEF